MKFLNVHTCLFLFLSPLLNNKPRAGTKILFLFQSLESIKSLSFKLLSKFLLKELINNECTKTVVQISIDSLLFLSIYSFFIVCYHSVRSFSWLFTWDIWPGRQKFTVLPRREKTIWRLPYSKLLDYKAQVFWSLIGIYLQEAHSQGEIGFHRCEWLVWLSINVLVFSLLSN